MKGERIQYVIFLLVIGILSWSLYFRVAFDKWIILNIDEPYYLKMMLKRLFDGDITEVKIKATATVSPLIAGYIHRFYSDKKTNLKLYVTLLIIGLLIIIYPHQRLVHLPIYVGMPLITIGYVIYIRSILAVSVWYFSRRLKDDQFNEENESFPQTKKKIIGKNTFHLEYDFINNKKKETGYLSFVNVFRSIFVWGIMGSGKTFSFISPIIYELMKMRFSLLIYDLKYPSLSSKAYGYFKKLNPKNISFFQICTTDMRYSNRCNPVAPRYIPSITEIEKICNNVLTNLKRPDESESAFFKGTASGLFVGLVALSKQMQLKHDLPVCSIPHVALLASVKTKYLLPILLSKKDLIMKVSSLRDAFDDGAAMEQLAGITASLQEKLSRLYQLDAFYIFSGDGDFSLDLNQKDHQKIVTVGCDKDKTEVMSPYLSMLVETIGKEANKPNKAPFASVLDELSSFYYGGLVDFLESGRENHCALIAGVQGMEQMDKKFPKAESSSIIGIQGSVICGMSGTKTASEITKRIGKTNQKRTGLNQQLEGSQTLNHTFYRDDLIPIDKISNFSQGEFCGVLADDLDNPIKQKRFWGKMKIHKCHQIPKAEMPLIHDFWNEEAKNVFKKHWHDMIDRGFFIDFQKAIIANEFIFVPSSVSFYLKYLEISNEDLEYLKVKHKGFKFSDKKNKKAQSEEFVYERFLADFYSNRLEKTIIENEKHQFLMNYLNQMYNDIENWVKKEYAEATGENITEDLFNLSDFKTNDLEEVPF